MVGHLVEYLHSCCALEYKVVVVCWENAFMNINLRMNGKETSRVVFFIKLVLSETNTYEYNKVFLSGQAHHLQTEDLIGGIY